MTEVEKLILEVEQRGAQLTTKELKEVEKAVKSLTKEQKEMSLAAKAAGVTIGLAFGGAIIGVAKKLYDASKAFQDINAQLVTTTGSTKGAAVAYDALLRISDETPFSLEETTKAFTKLVNVGLSPSERALKSYANIAVGTNQSLMSVVDEAAAAAEGRFLTLRQLGITTEQIHNRLILTYRGVKTEVAATNKEVEKYLITLGERDFGKAAATQSETLTGVLRTLHDEWDKVWTDLARLGPNDIIAVPFKKASEAVEELHRMLASGQLSASLGNWIADSKRAVLTVVAVFYTLEKDLKEVAVGTVQNFQIEWERLVGLASVTGRQVRDYLSGVGETGATNNYKQDIDNVNHIADVKKKRVEENYLQQSRFNDNIFQEIEDQHAQETKDAGALRKVYEDQQKAKAGKDQLAGFNKGGSTNLNDKSATEAAALAKKQLQDSLKLLEEGLLGENTVITNAYEERKKAILANSATTEQEKKDLILTALSESLVTEQEKVRQAYQERQDFILNNTTITEEAKTTLMKRLTEQREIAIADIERQHLNKRLDQAAEFFHNIASIGSTFGKKGFELAKAAAIAEATINTYKAATGAYAALSHIPYIGPALGIAAAAAAIVAGAANIATIKSQQYSGAFALGGSIPAGRYGLVGEAGPEFVRGPAVVTSAAATSAARSGVRTVVIHNNGAPVSASSRMNGDELMIVLQPLLDRNKEKTKQEIASDLRKGGGSVSRSLEHTYGMRRALGGGG